MCHSLLPRARAHAVALVEDGGEISVVTGQALIAGLAAGCSWMKAD